MEAKDYVSVFAAVISLMSASIAYFFARRTAKRTDKSLELQYSLKIYEWAKEVIFVMSEAISLGEFDSKKMASNDFFIKQCENYAKLSSLLDNGRLFFPNYQVEYGKEKPEAFQGIRREILDPIKEALVFTKKMDCVERDVNKELCKQITNCKRIFVSEVQKIIDPRGNERFFEEVRETKN